MTSIIATTIVSPTFIFVLTEIYYKPQKFRLIFPTPFPQTMNLLTYWLCYLNRTEQFDITCYARALIKFSHKLIRSRIL